MGRHPAVVDGLAEPSQRLVEAALSRDAERVAECLSRGDVDVNYVGTVSLRAKCSETILWEEAADEVRIGYEEFRTDVTALFAAAHSGHLEVARKLLYSKLFGCNFLVVKLKAFPYSKIWWFMCSSGLPTAPSHLLRRGCGNGDAVHLAMIPDTSMLFILL
ncbi:hypothetical protein ACLOJK_032041 [Asimina triloba]